MLSNSFLFDKIKSINYDKHEKEGISMKKAKIIITLIIVLLVIAIIAVIGLSIKDNTSQNELPILKTLI